MCIRDRYIIIIISFPENCNVVDMLNRLCSYNILAKMIDVSKFSIFLGGVKVSQIADHKTLRRGCEEALTRHFLL